MSFKDWSTTAADNDDADADINWEEGQAPSTVNGSARGMMAALKVAFGHVVNVKDYGAVGDGVTDDASAVQDAIDSSPSNTEVIFPNGTFLIGASGLSINGKSKFRLTGIGATIKLDAVATQTLATFGSTAISVDSCSDVTVSSLHIDGNAKASNLIGLRNCTDCKIVGNECYDGGVNALIFSVGGTRNRFIDNNTHDAIGAARGLWIGNINTVEHENDPAIRGNRSYSNPATGIGGTATGAIIDGNHSLDNAGAGIALGAVDSPDNYRRTVISNNICRGNSFHGIQSDASTDAQYSEHVTVTGNICEENAAAGIYVLRARDWVVSNNICRDNDFDGTGNSNGIEVDRAKRVVVSGNLCEDTRSGGSRTQEIGIRVVAQVAALDIEDVLVVGNICRNNTTSGINVSNSGSGTISGVSIFGNMANDNAINGINVTHASAGNVTEITVVGNHCQGNGTSDLRVDPHDAVISGNRYTLSPAGTMAFYPTFTDSDTTPSVKGRKLFRCANTGATTITTFDDGVPGQEITIVFTNSNTTVTDGGNLLLAGAANFTSSGDDTLSLAFDGTNWRETARSVN